MSPFVEEKREERDMNISYADGTIQEGLVLALAGPELRAAIRGADDPAEFRLVGDTWVAEDGRKVTFVFPLGLTKSQEFLTAIQEVTVEGLSAPRVCESGGECLLKRMAADPLAFN
ncbi:MAG: hypothetical protein ABSE42_05210 [Bryobacteraceae bacterium]|jgi:hypothetical protein